MNGIDQQTGLPHLPVGYFWNVSVGTRRFNFDRMILSIRKKRWWGSDEIASGSVGYVATNKKYLQDCIKRKAPELVSILEQKLREAEQRTESASLLGNYPPKTIIG